MNPTPVLREGTWEGTLHPSITSEINNKALHLIYHAHIPKREYRQWFNDQVMAKYCKKGKIEFLEIAHEGPDEANDRDHSHVVVITSYAIRSRDRTIFDWIPPVDPPSLLRPYVLVLKRVDEIESAKYMLGDEDPEYASYHDKYVKYRQRDDLSSKNALLDEDGKALDCVPCMRDPRCKISHLIRWQKQVYALMHLKAPRRLNYVYDRTSGSGKMTLLVALKNKDPISYRIILNGSNLKNTVERTPMIMDDEWNGHVLILNIAVSCRTITVSQEIVYSLMKAGDDSCCRETMWIFSNSLPTSLDTMDVSRIDFYMIDSIPIVKVMSDLQRLTHAQAIAMWQNRNN